MEVRFREIITEKHGRCLIVDNGTIEYMVSLDNGLRILRFAYMNEENILNDESDITVQSELGKWELIGGHRLAHSPESVPRTYCPDKGAVQYQLVEKGMEFKAGIEPWVQVEKKLEILFENKNALRIIHKIKNHNAWPIELAAWGITVIKPGGIHIIPLSDESTGSLPNRMIVFWPYTKIHDSRLNIQDNAIIIHHSPEIDLPLKIGVNNTKGEVAYINNNYLFIKKFDVVKEGIYPDKGVNYEVYIKASTFEIESLSPLKKLNPNEGLQHTEQWEIHRNLPDALYNINIMNILG